MIAAAPRGWLIDVAIVLILIGALSKSAIVPMHFWLPGAMAAPTPVSAYLHAAAMVKAGVYLVARLAPGFAETPAWRPIVLTLGVASMLVAGWRALRAYDLKLLLAFGTVSQLGFIIVLVGTGSHDAALAGMTMMLAHALFKASLFMVVGIIDHAAGTRDMRKLAHLGNRVPGARAIAALGRVEMAGFIPMLGFVGKEAALEALAYDDVIGRGAALATLVGVVSGSVLTVAYSVRFVWGAFAGKAAPSRARRCSAYTHPADSVVGARAARARRTRRRCRRALGRPAGAALRRHPAGLAELPPGTVARCRAAAGTDGAGAGVGRAALPRPGRDQPAASTARPARQRRPRLRRGTRRDGPALRRHDVVTQRGSLPLTQATILATLAVVPSIVLALGTRTGVELRLWDSPIQLAVGAIIVAAALAMTVMRNRLASVLLVGVAGYGCGVVFAVHGAPDLALTQFLVETLTLVVFVLVLRKLPAEVADRGADRIKLPRAVVAIAVGAMVTIVAAFAVNARSVAPISLALPEAAYTLGNGKNVVNVLLVDIRAWDTLGEISVLLVAATGVASLVFRHRRFGRAPRAADARTEGPCPPRRKPRGCAAVTSIPSKHRFLVLEVDHAAAVPDDDGALGIPLLLRPQRPRRRVRGWPDRGPGAGAALPRGWPLRTRRGGARRGGQDPRPRA